MNDKYLISAGADKAIVVWNYETGEKITRFGQQTNICVGLHLVHDKFISVTVDRAMRCFDIGQRKMVAQLRIDSPKSSSDGGLDATASVLWVEGSGRFFTVRSSLDVCTTLADSLRVGRRWALFSLSGQRSWSESNSRRTCLRLLVPQPFALDASLLV